MDLTTHQAAEHVLAALELPEHYLGLRPGRGWRVYAGKRELHPGRSQAVRNHSPDGFAWGYGGSGPAQLALALLLDTGLPEDLALDLYQDFKWHFVANWPGHVNWRLSRQVLLEWIETALVKEALSQLAADKEDKEDA